MDDLATFLGGTDLFRDLEPADLEALAALAVEAEHPPGGFVVEDGAAVDACWVVRSGAVEVLATVGGDVERVFMTVRAGESLGVAALVGVRLAGLAARMVEPTTLVRIDREKFLSFAASRPDAGRRVIEAAARFLADRLQFAVELVRRTIEWSADVAGVRALGLQSIMTDRVELRVDLAGGGEVRGRLLKVEPTADGHSLLLDGGGGDLHLVPWHAVIRVRIDRAAAAPHPSGDAPAGEV